MVNETVTAKFPGAVVTTEDIGVFGNDEGTHLTAAIDENDTVLSLDSVSEFDVHQWLALRGVNGFEIVQVDSVNLGQKQVTVDRPKDGTLAVAHAETQQVRATIPAVALNQLRAEVVALETAFGVGHVEGGIFFAGATGNLAQDAVNLFWNDATDQLRLAATGSAAGILIGGDAQIYRGAANRLDLASGDSLNLVAGDLLTGVDGAHTIGTASQRFLQGNFDRLGFATDASNPAHVEGLLFYDSVDKSLSYYTEEADVTMNVGREMWIRVRNQSGALISNGKVVYITGATGQLPTVELAKSDAISTSEVIGVATHDIENNSIGYVTTHGMVNDLDTSAFIDGDFLFLSDTVAGDITTTAPLYPSQRVHVGHIASSNPSTGKMFVSIEQQVPLFIEGSILFTDSAGEHTEDNTNFFWDNTNKQLQLATTGASAGILIGGDTQIYRGAANRLDLATGDSLNLVNGALLIGTTTVFEADRDLAVSLIPNADNTLDLGSSSRRFANAFLANLVLAAADVTMDGGLNDSPSFTLRAKYDSDPTAGVTSANRDATVTHNVTAGGASPASQLDLSIAGTPVAVLTDDGQAQLPATGSLGGLLIGGDAQIYRGAANKLYLASGDTLHLVSGLLESATTLTLTPASGSNLNLAVAGAGGVQVAGTTVFESDRDLAINLIPNGDDTLDLGSATRRWRDLYLGPGSLKVLASSGDANAVLQVSDAGIEFGAGGASPLDVLIERSAANTLRIADSLIVTGDLTVNGTTTTVNSTVVEIADNTIVLNDGEVGAGVTSGESGIEVDRGSLDNALVLFDETQDRWRVSYDADVTRHTLAEQAIAGTYTTGSVLFADSNGRLQEDAKLVWDNTAKELGVGASPDQALYVAGTRGDPATTGTVQGGLLRVTPNDGGSIALDHGISTSGYAWLQVSDRAALGTNHALALNPNGGNVGVGTGAPDDGGLSSYQTILHVDSVAGNSVVNIDSVAGGFSTVNLTEGGAWQYQFRHSGPASAFQIVSSDINGAGLDGDVLEIASGAADVNLPNGNLKIQGTKVIGTQEAAISSLTNSMSSTTTDGTLEDVSGVGTVSEAAVERNFSELNVKLNSVLTALRNHGIIAT